MISVNISTNTMYTQVDQYMACSYINSIHTSCELVIINWSLQMIKWTLSSIIYFTWVGNYQPGNSSNVFTGRLGCNVSHPRHSHTRSIWSASMGDAVYSGLLLCCKWRWFHRVHPRLQSNGNYKWFLSGNSNFNVWVETNPQPLLLKDNEVCQEIE